MRQIASFLRDVRDRKEIYFGKGFTFRPQWMAFEHADQKILELLSEALTVRELQGAATVKPEEAKYLPLLPMHVSRLLRLLMARLFRFSMAEETIEHMQIVPGPVQL